MQANQNLEEWDLNLEKVLDELKKCQVTQSLSSCTPCENFFDCELRKKYVSTVYESMNKGSSGGFEF